jgi:glycosyltransferase involved in cell wall biosynthesis
MREGTQIFPSVSVVIPAFNAAKTLLRALDSLADQQRLPDEVIVVDDGSQDATADLARGYKALRLEVLKHEQNAGSSAALNTAIRAARCPLIAFLDADDAWAPDKLIRQLALHAQNPALVMSATASHWVDETTGNSWYADMQPPRWSGTDFWRAQLARTIITKPTVIAQRQALLDAGGFDEQLRTAEDQKMWLALAFMGPVGFLAQPLTTVYVHQASLTARTGVETYRQELLLCQQVAPEIYARLPKNEARALLAERRAVIGAWREGAPLLAQALLLGINPMQQIKYLLATLPLLARLKAWWRQD